MTKTVFSISKKTVTLPLIANIPHSSTYIPPLIRQSFILNDNELEVELLKMTDWFVDELFSEVSEVGGTSVIYNVSRLVVDPERFENDKEEIMSTKGMGVIYTKTSDGSELRTHIPSKEEREDLLKRYYRPYHKAMESETETLLDSSGKCLILDCHSFPSKPLPYELKQDLNRPDICFGTDRFHTPKHLIESVEGFFQEHNLSTGLNRPFKGTYVPLKFLEKDKRVSSLMVEINRKLYMHEGTGVKSDGFDETRRIIGETVKRILETFFQL